jgi:hypothetical protein
MTKIPSIDGANVPALPTQLEKVFDFPQGNCEATHHPQMFVGSSQSDNVVTEQPGPLSGAYIGSRRFSALPATSSADNKTLVQGGTLSKPQATITRKISNKGHQRSLLWSSKKQKSHLPDDEAKPKSAVSTSMLDLRQNKRSMLTRRHTVHTDMLSLDDKSYTFSIPGLPVLQEESLVKDDSRPLLQFSLQYDVQRCSLTVHLHHASNLPAKDKRGTSDPFVTLYMMPNREVLFESKVVLQSLNPVFDESFEFNELATDEVRRQSLVFRLYDHDKYSKNDPIGGVILPLEDADLFGVVMRMEVDEDPKLFFKEVRGNIL